MSLPAVLTRNVCTQFDCVHLNQARKLLLLAKLQLWRREEKKISRTGRDTEKPGREGSGGS